MRLDQWTIIILAFAFPLLSVVFSPAATERNDVNKPADETDFKWVEARDESDQIDQMMILCTDMYALYRYRLVQQRAEWEITDDGMLVKGF